MIKSLKAINKYLDDSIFGDLIGMAAVIGLTIIGFIAVGIFQ